MGLSEHLLYLLQILKLYTPPLDLTVGEREMYKEERDVLEMTK